MTKPQKVVTCDERTRRGRHDKMVQFNTAAEMIESIQDDQDLGEAFVTLCVHAGIAAADVICCSTLRASAMTSPTPISCARMRR